MDSLDQADADLASKLEITEKLLASPSAAFDDDDELREAKAAEGNGAPHLRHALSNADRTLSASIAATQDIFEVWVSCSVVQSRRALCM